MRTKKKITNGRPRLARSGVRTGVGVSLSTLALKKLDKHRKDKTRSRWLNEILENL